MTLNDNYIIVPNNIHINEQINYLSVKDYNIIYIDERRGDMLYTSLFCVKNNITDDELKADAMFIINSMDADKLIIKYNNDKNANELVKNNEYPLIILNNYDINAYNYIINGNYISFRRSKQYWIPEKKEDFTKGMILEYFNNNKWNIQKVNDPEKEYDDMYKLLLKYKKLRVPKSNPTA